MTKEIIESYFLPYLQTNIGIYNKENRLLKSGRLIIFNIHEYTIHFVFSKKNGNYTYELPYPFGVIEETNKNLKLDYRNELLARNDDILSYKFILNQPVKKNKFYNTTLTIKPL